jgi:hypothetical protein
MSAFGGKADVNHCVGECPLLAISGHSDSGGGRDQPLTGPGGEARIFDHTFIQNPLGARQNRCTGKPALMPGADTAAPSVRLGNDDLRENQCDGYAARWSIKG